jgi:hypothetical protein
MYIYIIWGIKTKTNCILKPFFGPWELSTETEEYIFLCICIHIYASSIYSAVVGVVGS